MTKDGDISQSRRPQPYQYFRRFCSVLAVTRKTDSCASHVRGQGFESPHLHHHVCELAVSTVVCRKAHWRTVRYASVRRLRGFARVATGVSFVARLKRLGESMRSQKAPNVFVGPCHFSSS